MQITLFYTFSIAFPVLSNGRRYRPIGTSKLASPSEELEIRDTFCSRNSRLRKNLATARRPSTVDQALLTAPETVNHRRCYTVAWTCQYFSDRLRDVDSVWVKNEGFPLTKPVAVNTVLRNCAACDIYDHRGLYIQI